MSENKSDDNNKPKEVKPRPKLVILPTAIVRVKNQAEPKDKKR